MSRLRVKNLEWLTRFPRVSGDEPDYVKDTLSTMWFSPRERG